MNQLLRVTIIAVGMLVGCASPRSAALLGISYSDQPPRVTMRWNCNGQSFTTTGTGVCEQMAPSTAKVSVKIPPTEGRVVFSNGQLKNTEDFNWYPKAGFWLWKKKQIKDTWADIDLGQIASTYGDWPVALDVIGNGDDGVIVTRGFIYHRICDDQEIPCSHLVVEFECAGHGKATGLNQIGKCERLSGSPLALKVKLSGPGYQARPGARVYVRSARMGLGSTVTPAAEDFTRGHVLTETGAVLNGPTIVGVRLAWIDGGKERSVETRILVIGFSPTWTGLDQPHFIQATDGNTVDFVKPVQSDLLEANLYSGRDVLKKLFTSGKVLTFPWPDAGQIACAFAWQRESSDQTSLCLDTNLNEVPIP